MPKEITNPLKEGMPSKVYYYAFAKYVSRYAIARLIYNIPKGQIPPTAKVSNVVRDMRSDIYGKQCLIENDGGVMSDITPLIDEIEAELKKYGLQLTVYERDELIRFLDGGFRNFVLRDYERTKEGDLNAYSELMKILGSIVYTKLIINNLRVLGAGAFTSQVIKQFEKQFSPHNNPHPELQAVANVVLSPELLDKLAVSTTDHIMGAVRAQLTVLKENLKS